MTSDTIRKRAERLRRKEAGEVRVEVWLDAAEIDWVRRSGDDMGMSAAEVIKDALDFMRTA